MDYDFSQFSTPGYSTDSNFYPVTGAPVFSSSDLGSMFNPSQVPDNAYNYTPNLTPSNDTWVQKLLSGLGSLGGSAVNSAIGSGSALNGLAGGMSNQATLGILAALLSSMDRQKPTGGGTTKAYSSPGALKRTMTQGKYGPIASYAEGGIAGRFLQGAGDGVSDSIPATINGHQPAALADGEFVIPARVVSEIGNGSSQSGARKLQEMVDKINKVRHESKPVAADTKAEKLLPR